MIANEILATVGVRNTESSAVDTVLLLASSPACTSCFPGPLPGATTSVVRDIFGGALERTAPDHVRFHDSGHEVQSVDAQTSPENTEKIGGLV